MEFRLTYEGPLLGASRNNTRAGHKHEIRRAFHHQLRRLWEVTPALRLKKAVEPLSGRVRSVDNVPFDEWHYANWLGQQFARNGYNFVPLVTEELGLLCGISILFLRPDPPGMLVQSGDIDNRIKTLFDALRMPRSKEELGGYTAPSDGENPFFCLLEDDKLITRVLVETDTLLAQLSAAPSAHDARLVLTINIRPIARTWANGVFE